MDVAIEAIIILAFVSVVIALCVPLFAGIVEALPPAVSILGTTLSYIEPYIGFGFGMASELAGSSELVVSCLFIGILLPVLYFGVSVVAKICAMFVR